MFHQDSSSHTVAEAAYGIKNSTEELTGVLSKPTNEEPLKLSVVTRDTGGGAAVQRLHPELIRINVMDKSSKMLVCDMHNFAKPLEIACVDSWGRQGIGHRTPFQMIWLFIKITKSIRKEVGRKGLNEMWARVTHQVRTDKRWEKIAHANCKAALEEFFIRIETLEDENIDTVVKVTTEAPANVQDPVFSRWDTILAVL